MKMQISMKDELAQKLDTFARENYTNKSAVVTTALTQYLNANELTRAISDMAVSMRKIADTGVIDSDTQTQLQDFERLAHMLCQK